MKTIALVLLILLTSTAVRADQNRFAIGAGVTSAGTVNGGFVLAPTYTYSFHLSDQWEVAMTSRALVTGLVYKNPGVVVHNAPTLGYTWASGYVVAGPSFDIIATVLCGAGSFCNRVSGVAAGATLGGAYFWETVRDRLGVYIDAHLTFVPGGSVYEGPLVTVTGGPVFRFGTLTR